MSNTAVTLPSYANEMMPALNSPELKALFAEHFLEAMANTLSGFNRISLNGNRFTLSVAGKDVRTESDSLDMIIVGVAKKMHCQYYKNGYNGTNDGPPDAVWEYGTQAPSNVPASALTKVDGGTYGYGIRRRIICVVMTAAKAGQPAKPDFDTLYVFDLNAKSLFGPDRDVPSFGLGKAHGFQSYLAYMNSIRMYPVAVPVRVIMDRAESVPVVKFIPWAQNGNLMVLNEDILQKHIKPIMCKPELITMLDWSATGAPKENTLESVRAKENTLESVRAKELPVADSVSAAVAAPPHTIPPAPQQTEATNGDIYAKVAELTNAPVITPPATPTTPSENMPDLSGFAGITPTSNVSPTPETALATRPAVASPTVIPDIDENTLEKMLADATQTLSKV